MTGKIFRIVAAFTMLVLYTTTMAASGVVVLACHGSHHCGDVHTCFEHIHASESSHCSHHECHHQACAEADKSSCSDHANIVSTRCCNHNHSNNIALYTQPRSADDDHSERQSVLLAVVTDTLDHQKAQSDDSGYDKYGEYLLPSLLEGYARCGALRAPPALV